MAQGKKNEGNIDCKHTCCLPKVPVESSIVRPPKGLPIYFYNIKWFKTLDHAQKQEMADSNCVAFFLTPEDCLKPKRHPNEKTSGKLFAKKYCDIVVETCELQEFEEEESGEDVDDRDSIDLEAASPDCSESESDGLYAPGEYSYKYDEFIYNGESGVSDNKIKEESETGEEEEMEGVEV
ncbi:hypothetical protein O181_088463 [Austropuccinia psidii MF-1]|uniref:Uncharacterized protein n=1 Tax=Austropuccinia psidii MF-1 TaxID=1389203 RepID=A0A9Q3P2W5_9BASI|nr:hypothetical protein [Austropuccinia psidii MF-1]